MKGSSAAERIPGSEEESVGPALKWAGGKRWLVPRLREIFSGYRNCRLIEPFAGGLSVALGLEPERALLSDINPHSINFYSWLQRGLKIEFPMLNDADCFYVHRRRFNELISGAGRESAEAAGLFYYLNRTCFNGLCRFNSRGLFNVPFGKYAKINYTTDFGHYVRPLESWEFRCGDFEQIATGRRDFVYADPPYDVEFTRYSKDDFKWEDQQRLATWLSDRQGSVVVSNQATDRILELYRGCGFQVEIVEAPRMISCNGDRTPAKEMLAVKNVEIPALKPLLKPADPLA